MVSEVQRRQNLYPVSFYALLAKGRELVMLYGSMDAGLLNFRIACCPHIRYFLSFAIG